MVGIVVRGNCFDKVVCRSEVGLLHILHQSVAIHLNPLGEDVFDRIDNSLRAHRVILRISRSQR